jgi:electron transfer flavoprotein alpha subunit
VNGPSTTHRIAVLLPPDDGAEGARNLVDYAAGLAATNGCALDVMALRRTDVAAIIAPTLSVATTWWDVTHADLARIDADNLVEICGQFLAAAGIDDAAPRLLLLPSGSLGEEIAARMAARLHGVSLGRCVALAVDAHEVTCIRAAYGGRAQLGLATSARLCAATLRPAVSQHAGAAAIAPERRTLQLDGPLPTPHRSTLSEPADALPALEGARVVVSGGRGMQGDEGFALLARIAAQLGAALGGSLPTVDAGWVPVARQIGQSGKFVSPRMYFAVGISGTPQHLAGVAAESRIVAINKDAQAPIFSVAEVGAVADWRELLPLLAERLEAAAAG